MAMKSSFKCTYALPNCLLMDLFNNCDDSARHAGFGHETRGQPHGGQLLA